MPFNYPKLLICPIIYGDPCIWVIRFSLRSVYYIVLPYYCFACVTQRRAHDEGCFGAAATSVLCHSRHTVHTLYHHHHLLKSGGEKSGHEKIFFFRDPFLKKKFIVEWQSVFIKTSVYTTKQLSYEFFFTTDFSTTTYFHSNPLILEVRWWSTFSLCSFL